MLDELVSLERIVRQCLAHTQRLTAIGSDPQRRADHYAIYWLWQILARPEIPSGLIQFDIVIYFREPLRRCDSLEDKLSCHSLIVKDP